MKFDLNKKIEITREDYIEATVKAVQKLIGKDTEVAMPIMVFGTMVASAIDTELFDTPDEKQEEVTGE